jgi:CheY-like chemotaxis protein
MATQPRREPRRVLVIDDHPDSAEALQYYLHARSEDQVETAVSADEGLAKARAFHPEVVICDVAMPVVDGLSFAKAVREDSELRAVLLIAISGWTRPRDAEQALAAGFDYFLPKPVDLRAARAAPAPEGLDAGAVGEDQCGGRGAVLGGEVGVAGHEKLLGDVEQLLDGVRRAVPVAAIGEPCEQT